MAVDGTYKVEVDTPMGKQELTLTLKADGDKLSGTMVSATDNVSFTGGAVKGDEVSWNAEVNTPMGKMALAYQGKVAGSDISGEVSVGSFGKVPFKGRKA
ncbi:MAG: hypothetical protein WC370_09745 [Dehalococcoidales bacterium]|jgi:hypothetical protein